MLIVLIKEEYVIILFYFYWRGFEGADGGDGKVVPGSLYSALGTGSALCHSVSLTLSPSKVIFCPALAFPSTTGFYYEGFMASPLASCLHAPPPPNRYHHLQTLVFVTTYLCFRNPVTPQLCSHRVYLLDHRGPHRFAFLLSHPFNPMWPLSAKQICLVHNLTVSTLLLGPPCVSRGLTRVLSDDAVSSLCGVGTWCHPDVSRGPGRLGSGYSDSRRLREHSGGLG